MKKKRQRMAEVFFTDRRIFIAVEDVEKFVGGDGVSNLAEVFKSKTVRIPTFSREFKMGSENIFTEEQEERYISFDRVDQVKLLGEKPTKVEGGSDEETE